MNGSVMFDADFLKGIGGWDGRTRVAADTDIFIRTLAENDIHNIQECLYNRRFHKDSLTSGKDLGIRSDFRKRYNLNRSVVAKEALLGRKVIRDFYYPRFDYQVHKCVE